MRKARTATGGGVPNGTGRVVLSAAEREEIEGYNRQIDAAQVQRAAALRMLLRSRGADVAANWRYEGGALVREAPPAGASDTLRRAVEARDQDRLEEAERLARLAMGEGAGAGPYLVLASVMGFRGEHAPAIALLDQALTQYPVDVAAIRFERAFQRLLAGQWRAGWEDWEFRGTLAAHREALAKFMPGIREWDGRAKERVLVMGEKGIGDQVLFARYLPLMVEAGCVPVLCSGRPQVHALLRGGALQGVLSLAPEDAVPVVSSWVAMESLPYRLGLAEPVAPLRLPWPTKAHQGFRVGVAWHGDPDGPSERRRPKGTADWEPLWRVGGVEWVSLQIGETMGPCAPGVAAGACMADTCEAIAGLDLVITAETLICHLANAVGVEVWMPLHHLRNWPWTGGGASAWYPGTTVFAEKTGWKECFEAVAQALQERLERCG